MLLQPKLKQQLHICILNVYTLKAGYVISNVQAGLVTVIPSHSLCHVTLNTNNILAFLYQIIRKNSPSGWKTIIKVIRTMLQGVNDLCLTCRIVKNFGLFIYLLIDILGSNMGPYICEASTLPLRSISSSTSDFTTSEMESHGVRVQLGMS